MGPRLSVRPLHVLLVALPFLAFGCQNGGHSPTEPALQSKTAAVTSADGQAAPASATAESTTVAADRGGNGNGNGHGNGGNGNGNGNGGNGNGGRGADLQLQIQPDEWNTNWAHAEGLVQAFVRGTDASKIVLASVKLASDQGGPISPRSARIAGGQLVASFSKSDAIGLLTAPKRGDRATVTLSFDVGSDHKQLTDQIRIVGPDDGSGGPGQGSGELRLDLDPDDWNVNWAHSSGFVHAFLRGPGLKDVDLATVRLVGDKTSADPLAPSDVRLVGNQIAARFAKSAAFATLDNPKPRETHTVKIRFTQGGTQKELSARVHVEGGR
ncbi:MAG: hypothetical protein QOF89_112 [Acidobacteriota bacterium]|jgi:hypothetical protein|nr:hypothetical protein [Acidobacteriota bacterium]